MRIFLFLLFISFPVWAAQGQTLQDGIDLLHQGKIKESLPLITAIAEERPQDGNAQMALGYVLLRSGDYQRAGKVLRAALTSSGERSEIHRLLAEIAAQQGDFPVALEEIDKALRLAPQDKEILAYKEKLTKEWQIEEKMDKNYGGNFTVTFEGGGDELGSAALAVLEEAYVELGSRFQLWPQQKTEVILYGNRDFASLTNSPDWSGGLYDGKIRIPVGGLSGMNEKLRRILYHEYTHVLIRALAGNHVPLWLNEGLAQWAAGETTAHLDQRLAKGEKLLPFARLEKTFAGFSETEAALAYAQSLSLTNFLIERFGEAQIIAILHQFGSGTNFQIAVEDILAPWGGNFDNLVQAWQATVLSSPL